MSIGALRERIISVVSFLSLFWEENKGDFGGICGDFGGMLLAREMSA